MIIKDLGFNEPLLEFKTTNAKLKMLGTREGSIKLALLVRSGKYKTIGPSFTLRLTCDNIINLGLCIDKDFFYG